MLNANDIALKGAAKVKKEVRNWIRRHCPSPGDRFMSQRELAKLLDVDPMTAHKALSELTEEGVLYRVQGKGSFIGNSPREIHSLNLAMALARPDLDNPVTNSNHWHIVQRVITGVMQSLKDHDTFSTAIVPVQTDSRRAEDRLQAYDAVIFLGDQEYSDLIKTMLKSRKMPLIIIDSLAPADADAGIRLSLGLNESVYRGITHMAKSGYRRIAYIGSEYSMEKFAGYKRALADYALPLEEENVVMGIDEQDSGARGASILYGRGLNCDSIFVDTDFKAVGVIDYLNKQGVKVPEDIGVMGFDGIDSCISAPLYLTTVKTCHVKLIAAALDFLRQSERKKALSHYIEIPGNVVPNRTLKVKK